MADKTAPRLKARYTEQVRPALQKEFQHRNVMEIPRVVKVVVNMGVGWLPLYQGYPSYPYSLH